MTNFWMNYGFYAWLVTIIIIVGISIVCVVMARRIQALDKRYTTLLSGVEGATLEDIWQTRAQQVSQHATQLHNLEQQFTQLQEQTIQHIGLIRFNPFDDVGGDQSFALALLDGEHKGVVVSSIYSRTGGRIYAKPLGPGTQARALSQEEEMAIALALGQGEVIPTSSSN